MSDGDDDESVQFGMTLPKSTARWLETAYPDQMGKQERLRAAIAEVRLRRRETDEDGRADAAALLADLLDAVDSDD
jgi:hypothetical protein